MNLHHPLFFSTFPYTEVTDLDDGQFCFDSPLVVCYLEFDLGVRYGEDSFLDFEEGIRGAE